MMPAHDGAEQSCLVVLEKVVVKAKQARKSKGKKKGGAGRKPSLIALHHSSVHFIFILCFPRITINVQARLRAP